MINFLLTILEIVVYGVVCMYAYFLLGMVFSCMLNNNKDEENNPGTILMKGVVVTAPFVGLIAGTIIYFTGGIH